MACQLLLLWKQYLQLKQTNLFVSHSSWQSFPKGVGALAHETMCCSKLLVPALAGKVSIGSKSVTKLTAIKFFWQSLWKFDYLLTKIWKHWLALCALLCYSTVCFSSGKHVHGGYLSSFLVVSSVCLHNRLALFWETELPM